MGCVYSIPKKHNESNKIVINSNTWYLSNELGSGTFGWVRKATKCRYTYKNTVNIVERGAVKIVRKSYKHSKYILDAYDDNEYYSIDLIYNELRAFEYPQYKSVEFVNGLSIIDAIFNIDFDGIKIIFTKI